MNLSKEIKKIMLERDVNLSELATMLNTSQPNLSAKFKRNDFRISEIIKILDLLDYELKIEFIETKKD